MSMSPQLHQSDFPMPESESAAGDQKTKVLCQSSQSQKDELPWLWGHPVPGS